jgi:hypothetical protein
MRETFLEQFKFRFKRMINLAFGLAMIDGGFIIAVQISVFLLTYFLLLRAPAIGANNIQSMLSQGQPHLVSYLFAMSLIAILNVAIIIYRITGIARGNKYNLLQCFGSGLRNFSALFVLYILAGIIIESLSSQISQIFLGLFPQLGVGILIILKALLLFLLPYGLFTCAYVVDQNKNPIRAIIATYKFIRYKGDFLILAAISFMYSMPVWLAAFASHFLAAQYLGLLTSLWFLFCHILTLVAYIDNFDKQTVQQDDPNKPTKVVII